MSCLKERGIKVVAGLSSWDVHLPAPLPAELLLVELLFDTELIEGETYMGYRWPVLLFRWTDGKESKGCQQ